MLFTYSYYQYLSFIIIIIIIIVDKQAPFVHVEDIVKTHWSTYGRSYYCRYDYEGVDSAKAAAVMNHIRSQFATLPGQVFGSFTVASSDEFTYVDPIDKSVSKNQGLRVLFVDGSRVIFRLSGTAGSGATVRVYFEKYEDAKDKLTLPVGVALEELVKVGLSISNIIALTGFASPTVIT